MLSYVMTLEISELEKRGKLRALLLDELENSTFDLEKNGIHKREINTSLTLHAAIYMGDSNEVRENFKRWNELSSKEKDAAFDPQPIFDKLISVAKDGNVERATIVYHLLSFAYRLLEPDWEQIADRATKYRQVNCST